VSPISITVVGLLKNYTQNQESLALDAAGKNISQVLAELGIPSVLVAVPLINGRQESKDYVLQDGDIVKLIPLVGGG